MVKRKGLNKHQKAAFRPGEHRTRSGEIEELLELSHSSDPVERCHAAENLCPCHVRRRIDDVWAALYRMMQDPDVHVRRAAWHTLEDGGTPNDPAFLPILTHALEYERDRQVRRFAEMFASIKEEQEMLTLQRAMSPRFNERGRCDFCGTNNAAVRRDYDTELAVLNQGPRHAYICASCDGG